ncbi:MAG: LamG-like jellyroll fold domain-containing protein [Myxococcota bacterium]
MRGWIWLGLVAATACGDDGSTIEHHGDDDDDATDRPTTDDTGITTTDPGPNPTTSGDAETCALLFGGNDRIRGPDEGLPLGTLNRTVQLWVRTTNHHEQVAFGYGRPSPEQGFMIGTINGRPMVRAGSSNAVVVGAGDIADDAWHHFAAAYDGRLVVLTVDGDVVGTGELVTNTIEGDVVAGNTPTGDLSKPWIGWLDDAKVFYGARAPHDIAEDLDGELLGPDDLLLWWDFEVPEGTAGPGVTIPDISGHGHDATTGGSSGTPDFPRCR